MKLRTSDRNLILITCLALLAELLWLLLHMGILPSPWSSLKRDHLQNAGYVLKTESDVKRRSKNQLLWEDTSQNDSIYYYDSVLTLSQSTATLFLHEKTEVHLSENTLVTIEPQTESNQGHIRLKFTRGDLRARNPFARTEIRSETWTLSLNSDSEVEIKQSNDENFEIELKKGEGQLLANDIQKELNSNEVLLINENKETQVVALSKDLSWKEHPPGRVYFHGDEARVDISWAGLAEKILLTQVGSQTLEIPLQKDQSVWSGKLSQGRYSLRLKQGQSLSSTLNFEVWKAPVIHLLTPLPRDRYKTGENIDFVWSHIPEADSYELVFSGNRSPASEEKIQENAKSMSLQSEGDYEWSVEALDQEGYRIPALYKNPLHIRDNPLSAPKLKTPEMRKAPSAPKTNSSFFKWWRLLVTHAYAKAQYQEEHYEAVFAWEAVPGADIYQIEISETPDFRIPVVNKTVNSTEYIWKNFKLGSYYWRVAAGDRRGRMGLFSEAVLSHFTDLPSQSMTAGGVIIRRKADSPRVEIATEDQAIIESAPKPPVSLGPRNQPEIHLAPKRDIATSYYFAWTPQSQSWNLEQNQNTKAKFNGTNLLSFHFQTEQKYAEDKNYLVDISYTQSKWSPHPQEDFPFQTDLSWAEAQARILWGDSQSLMQRGLVVLTVPELQRTDTESVRVSNPILIGPSALWILKNHQVRREHLIEAAAGANLFLLRTAHEYAWGIPIENTGTLYLGLKIQVDGYFKKDNFSSGYGLGLSLGFESP